MTVAFPLVMSVDAIEDLRAAQRDWFAACGSYPVSYYIEADGGARFNVIWFHHPLLASDRNGQGFARGQVGNHLVFFEQTGTAVRSGMVRCRITCARDLERADDLVAFDGEHFGGRMSAEIAHR